MMAQNIFRGGFPTYDHTPPFHFEEPSWKKTIRICGNCDYRIDGICSLHGKDFINNCPLVPTSI